MHVKRYKPDLGLIIDPLPYIIRKPSDPVPQSQIQLRRYFYRSHPNDRDDFVSGCKCNRPGERVGGRGCGAAARVRNRLNCISRRGNAWHTKRAAVLPPHRAAVMLLKQVTVLRRPLQGWQGGGGGELAEVRESAAAS